MAATVTKTGRQRGRRFTITGAVVLGVAVAIAVPLLRTNGDSSAAAAGLTPVTARVERATLTSELRLNGQLSFGSPEPLLPAAGMLTALPSVGQTVEFGEPVYAVDGSPVVLFTGEMPFWRDLSTATTCSAARPCADVAQLQQNLIDLGYLNLPEPSGIFGSGTRQAVRDWQRALGLEVTGRFAAASVVVAPSPSIRIAEVTARLGERGVSPAASNATALHGTVTLTEAQSRELAIGMPVTVVLRDGTEVAAVLSAIDPGGESTSGGSATTPPTATIHFASQLPLTGVGESSIRAIVHADDVGAATLIVPATAILATVENGYAVEVWDGAMIRRVPVEIGRVADARVQILGGDLAEGDLVVLSR